MKHIIINNSNATKQQSKWSDKGKDTIRSKFNSKYWKLRAVYIICRQTQSNTYTELFEQRFDNEFAFSSCWRHKSRENVQYRLHFEYWSMSTT